MDSVERNTEEENETTATEVNQVLDSDEQQHTLDEYIREVHERDEYSDEECDEDYDELANMWHYDVATGEPCQRFSTLLKNLVTKYLTPVKRIYSSRPLEKSTLITTIFEQLKLLGMSYFEPIEGDPEKFVVYVPCDSEKKTEIIKTMSKEKKLQYQETQKNEAKPTKVSTHTEHMEPPPQLLGDSSPKIPRDLPAKTSSKYARDTSRKSTPAKLPSTKSPSKITSKPWK
ncbi:uncharacterized protein LOC109856421 isoform X1 [Pseudomyrmex gracilis]|uniref:uncharacterized protein LOC109856421 isoform X1 n=1 Tax=Pseudomyrmex gracilis TaxID=219809 RepID=UPI0009959D52|nr:uncharacterized protein LOC109856421 isoform X1 [Pseudomyrmex gracilis]